MVRGSFRGPRGVSSRLPVTEGGRPLVPNRSRRVVGKGINGRYLEGHPLKRREVVP